MYFKEFKEMKAHQSLLFSIGVITVFFGVYLIATSQGDVDIEVEVEGIDSDRTVLTLDNQTTTDLERGDTDRELLRKRSDSNGMIMGCTNSPYQCETSSKKFSTKNPSINISNKSENIYHVGGLNEFDNADSLDDDFITENDVDNSFEGIELLPPSEICTLLPVQRNGNGAVHTFSPSHSHKHNSNASVSSTSSNSTSSTSFCPTSYEKSPVQIGTLHMTPSQINNNNNNTNFNIHTDILQQSELKESKGLKDYKWNNIGGNNNNNNNNNNNDGKKIETSNISPGLGGGVGGGLNKSKSENLSFSPLTRHPVTLHLRERSLSSCGLLEMSQSEDDGIEE